MRTRPQPNCDLVCTENFCCSEDVYCPNEDTWLAYEIIESIEKKFDVCVDLGTGSTVLMEPLSKRCKIVIGIDINPCVADICNKLGRICLICDGLRCLRKADLIVANLPYLPCEDSDWLGIATCDIHALRLVKEIDKLKPRVIVLIFSTLTRFNPLEILDDYVIVTKRTVKVDFEEIIGVLLELRSKS